MNKILIGSDEGLYTVTNGARTITLTGLSFIPTIDQLAYVYNKTQDKLYYTPAPKLAKCTLTGGVITIDSSFPVLVTGDIIHIQIWLPMRAYATDMDATKVITQNPEYGHFTSVETLVAETAWPGLTSTQDEGTGDANTIVDTAAFTLATTNDVIGYKVWSITDGTYGNVLSYNSNNSIETSGGTIVSWAGDAFKMPVAKRFEIPVDSYNFLTLHWRLAADLNTAYTMKMYGTLDAAATVDSDNNWVDMSVALLGAAAIYADGITAVGTVVTENIKVIPGPATMLKYMIKIVAEGKAAAASGSSATVFIKKSS